MSGAIRIPDRDPSGEAKRTDAGGELGGCWKVVCLSLVFAVLGPLVWGAGRTVIDRLDSSEGVEDPALANRLAVAIGFTPVTVNVMSDFYVDEWHMTEALSDDSFASRARAVPGWDQIALIAPGESGDGLIEDPALTSWWMRQRLSGTLNRFQSEWYRLLVIRDQAVVADFSFHDAHQQHRTALVSRVPMFGRQPGLLLVKALFALGGIAMLVLLVRAVRTYGWRRAAIGFVILLFSAFAAATVVLGLLDWPYKVLAPLNRTDPAIVRVDAWMVEQLQRALSETPEGRMETSSLYPGSGAVVVPGKLSLEEFRARASRVPGWDQIVIVGPYDKERLVADDPALATAALREEVRTTHSWEADEMWELLVVRGGEVVGWMTLDMSPAGFWSCVVEREP